MTLLTALNRAQRRLSLSVTSGIVADGQETQNLLWELANTEADEALRRTEYTFSALIRSHSFTATTGATLQASGKPSNFDRIIPDTLWNRTTDRQIVGPLTDEEWAIANGAPIVSAVTQYAMLRYDGLHIFAAPTTADTIAYEYAINTPIQATGGGAYKTAFTADNDEYLLGDAILVLGVVWRYKADKGREYAEDLKNYEIALAKLAVAQRGSRKAYVATPDMDPFGVNVPETGFGA